MIWYRVEAMNLYIFQIIKQIPQYWMIIFTVELGFEIHSWSTKQKTKTLIFDLAHITCIY